MAYYIRRTGICLCLIPPPPPLSRALPYLPFQVGVSDIVGRVVEDLKDESGRTGAW